MPVEPRSELNKFSGSHNLKGRMVGVVGAPGMESVAVPVLSRVHSKLREKGFIPADFNFYRQVQSDMLQGLLDAQNGQPGSISLIPHDLTPRPILRDGIGQSYVYGGTGYGHSTFEVRDGNVVAELHREDRPLEPGENIIDLIAQDFTRKVGGRSVEVQAVSGNIGQALDPTTGPFGELDGTPKAESQGVKGQSIALRAMGDMVRERVGHKMPATFANDTIAITDQHGAAIIGTGFNKSLIGRVRQEGTQLQEPRSIDSRSNLYDFQGLNVEDQAGKRIAFNLESGAQQMPESMSGLIARIDAQLDDPKERNKHEIEKVAAGGYLPINYNLAAEDLGLDKRDRIKTTKELDALAESHPGEAGEIARVLLIRSAMLEAAQLAAVYQFMGDRPITLIGDGSLITKGWNNNFKDLVQQGLQMLGVPEGGVIIKTPKDVAMKGARGLLTGSIAA